MAMEKILVVEDDSIIAMEIQTRLESMDYIVADILAYGEDVIEKAAEQQPDLILMDIILKGEMDGIDACRALKEKFDIPVIYLTAHADVATLDRAKLTDPFGYILKPFVNRELQTSIDMALYKHRMGMKLKESEEKFRNLVEASSDWVWEVDGEYRYTYSSPKVEELLGFKPEEIIGKRPFDLMPEEEAARVEKITAEVFARRGSFKCFINKNIHKEGRTVILETSGVPVFSIEGDFKGYRGIDRDVTERELAEQELKRKTDELQRNKGMLEEKNNELSQLNSRLEESKNELRELNFSKDKFFSILAHDLRSPFNSLLAFSKLLSEEYDSLTNEEKKKFIANINDSTSNLYHLVENLLEWSRIQTGKLQSEPEELDLKEFAAGIIYTLIGNAMNKNIEIVNDVEPDTFVRADERMLNSVLQNLVSNAIKFTKQDGKITVTSRKAGGMVEISVKDTGVGIKENDLKKLFRIDVQHSTNGTANERGTGLGLILCKELVMKCGGDISVESELAVGTTFTFTLPNAG